MPRCGILSGNVVTKFRRLQLKVIFALLILFTSVSFSMLQAQDASAAKPAAPDGAKTATAPTPAAPTKDPVASSLRLSLTRSQKNTLGAIAAMPADKFPYKPTPDQITFGHLVAHIAEANYFLCSKAADVPQPKVDEAKETDPKDKLLAAAKASFDFCNDALAKMDDSKLGDSIELYGGRQFPRAVAALGLPSSWADHYAAAAMYLRLNNILPPTAQPKK
jgi:DinB family protein